MSILGQIRPGERRQTYAASVLIGGIMAAHSLIETARDALFLARLPPARLAWVYLAIAGVSLALFVLQERRGVRSGRTPLATWLVVSAAVDVLLWSVIAQPGTWALYTLYIWSGVFASLVVVRFWTLLGDLFSISQAKRVFSLIGAGGVGGAILGSLLARTLTRLRRAARPHTRVGIRDCRHRAGDPRPSAAVESGDGRRSASRRLRSALAAAGDLAAPVPGRVNVRETTGFRVY